MEMIDCHICGAEFPACGPYPACPGPDCGWGVDPHPSTIGDDFATEDEMALSADEARMLLDR